MGWGAISRRTVAAACLIGGLATAGGLLAQPTGLDDKALAFRRDLLDLIDKSELLLNGAPAQGELLKMLRQARADVEAIPAEQFIELAPALGNQMAQLNRLTATLERRLAEDRGARPAVKSAAFPSASYPNVSWSFLIDAFGEDEDDVPGGDPESADEGDVCSLANAPSANTQFSLVNLSLVAEAARDTADRLCSFFLGVLAGGNGSLACIVTDILFLIERGIVDNELLCSDNVQAAEVTGSYNRIGHLHDDLDSAKSNLTSRLDTAETNLTAEVNFNEALLLDLDADLVAHDQNLTARANTIDSTLDAQAQFLVEFRQENLRVRIERFLAAANAAPLASFQLPEAFGGFLEEVRDVVAEALANEPPSGSAAGFFQKGEQRFSAGEYKRALDDYAKAYRAAAR